MGIRKENLHAEKKHTTKHAPRYTFFIENELPQMGLKNSKAPPSEQYTKATRLIEAHHIIQSTWTQVEFAM